VLAKLSLGDPMRLKETPANLAANGRQPNGSASPIALKCISITGRSENYR